MPHDEPETAFYADFHMYRWHDGYELHLEKFKEGSEAFSALVTCVHRATADDPNPALIATRRINLWAPTTVASLGKTLSGKKGLPTPDNHTWESRLEDVVYRSWAKYQEGSSILRYADEIELDYSTPLDLLPGLWADDGVTLDYGDGSAGKSMLVLAQGASVVTGIPLLGMTPARVGPVGYFDWEDGERMFSQRLAALCATAGIPVPHGFMYRQMDRPIHSGEMRIRREVEEEGMVACIFDSVGEMLGGDPSDPALVIGAINAMKHVGVPALGIHHLTGEQAKSKSLADKQKPYGSVYARSGARMMWLIEGFDEPDGTRTIYAHNTKANHGQKRKPLSWSVEYGSDAQGHLRSLGYTTRSASDYYDRLKDEVPAAEMTVKDAVMYALDRGQGFYHIDGLLDRLRANGKTCERQSVVNALGALVREGRVTATGDKTDRRYIASDSLTDREEGA